MTPANKKIWIKALRSGKYKQGRRNLCKNNKFCCLGVAYDVLIDGEWTETWIISLWGITYNGRISTGILPQNVKIKIGLTSEDHGKLIVQNDAGKTFPEIANWIEKHL